MSETAEKEIEVVAGTIGGITQKKADTWTVAVTPEGSQYAKNLWTKDAELVESLAAKIGQAGAFVTSASYWKMNDGKQVRSLWIQGDGMATPEAVAAHEAEAAKAPSSVATPAAAPQAATSQPRGGGDVDWDAKERRDFRSRAWAQTLGAFTHTIKVDESPEDVFLRLQPFQRKVYEDVCGTFAYDPSGEDIPF